MPEPKEIQLSQYKITRNTSTNRYDVEVLNTHDLVLRGIDISCYVDTHTKVARNNPNHLHLMMDFIVIINDDEDYAEHIVASVRLSKANYLKLTSAFPLHSTAIDDKLKQTKIGEKQRE